MNTVTNHRQIALANQQVSISCVVPIHNEQEVISDFLQALTDELKTLSHQFEIIVINDGSRDISAELVKAFRDQNPETKLLSFSRNFGKEVAIAAGLQHAKSDVTIIIDADFQHPLRYIKTFLQHWSDGYDMVYGLRQDRANESWFKRTMSRIFYRMLDWMTDVTIPPDAGDYRLMDRKVVQALNACKERARFMKGLYAWVGYKSLAVPFEVANRAGGTPSYRYGKLTSLAINGFISFSDVPLRIWGLIGAFICGISFLSILYIIIDTIFFGVSVQGYATLLVTVVFFGGMQLLSVGVLGEYLSRVFNEVKHRPAYLIEESLGLDDD